MAPDFLMALDITQSQTAKKHKMPFSMNQKKVGLKLN